ncbi:response regulator transcription factor [Oceanirhabdus sp. W0125-5]|uniref:response regulator transcription factor n=1 Tax=Oceanirhabdus sp. W0125-5 TaxID=2999116 RepID=UPI0022F2E371|nr:response regulator transcription factor [Oceanirhabdus sp. W0125-5]WBW97255.1 response regulator transcription factor [Oceanirhabdus sp. W0125-5]
MFTIFLIEDDLKLCNIVKEHLKRFKYNVVTVESFDNVEEQFKKLSPHLVLLDINLPYLDGFYLCRAFRKISKAPIIITSARSGEMEQIMGMELGADDYVTKPFNIEILHAKIKVALRRCYGEYSQNDVIKVNSLELIEETFKLNYYDKFTELSKNEMKLIKKLIQNADKVLSREELLEALWDEASFVDDNALTVNVNRIRNKLLELGIDNLIKTKRGAGYFLDSTELE